jgi:molybdopterin-containing oxidoreductase family membrane subunit
VKAVAEIRDVHEDVLFAPIEHSGHGFYWAVACLSVLILWGAIAYAVQFTEGLGVTGLHQPVSWGFYVTNFVFFIGISHAGTLVSAILRVTGAEWRRPITRMAEGITVFALVIGAPMIVIDMGRPDRILNVVLHARLQSPILWDVLSVTTYLCGSLLYLYLPMIPDLALLRDLPAGTVRALRFGPVRRWVYRKMALGWQGTPEQWRRLERAISAMAVVIICCHRAGSARRSSARKAAASNTTGS